ncbi:MAG: type II secretion system ATPase GspE [Sedimentisphaerales bacterium]|nr:type II secretion system ATPase GspE [Sedimentisphaerales bacterium]
MRTELIGQILLQQTSLAEQQLADALQLQNNGRRHERIGQILIRAGHVTETEVLKALARQWGLSYLDDVPQKKLNKDLIVNLPIEFLKKHKILPFNGSEDMVNIAVCDPLDVMTFDAVVKILGVSCKKIICSSSVIEDRLSHYYYHGEGSAAEALTELDDSTDFSDLSSGAASEDLLNLANRAPVVKLVNTIFFQAVQARASDIHIEPYEDEVVVRFRIDGVLHNRFTLGKQYVAALVSRLKVMANLNIAERRLPQDGRSRIKISDNEIDIRVSTVPSSDGERVVLRLLDKSGAQFSLDKLGFAPETEKEFRRLIHISHGIILLTGPTGSGKTTTLYGVLSELNTEVRNIMTVEDPIEYKLAGIGQMQIHPKIGLTFANYLRHILRQDPDVIMVGEIRDLETAQIAIQAALTGHLVLSTLHTNDSASAITRLVDMGIEPYLVCSSVIGIMAQRLVRIICPKCKAPYKPGEDELELFDAKLKLNKENLYHGTGCSNCINTGYLGREGIFELMTIDDEIRESIIANAGSNRIKQIAIKKGMFTLRQDGLRKALAGNTTIKEVLRVAQDATI